jgi:toxin ParE1/3/4
VRVEWTLRARRELAAQRRYIRQTQPEAATRLAQRVLEAIDRLATHPHLGRAALWDATGRLRELPVARTPFVVLYTIDEASATLVVTRVLHGAQRRGPD